MYMLFDPTILFLGIYPLVYPYTFVQICKFKHDHFVIIYSGKN